MYDYILKRSKRRTLSVSISFDNIISVHCPMRMSVKDVEKFLTEKSWWINKHIVENNKRLSLNREIIEYKKVLIDGIAVPLTVGDKNCIEQNVVTVKDIKYIKPLYIKTFSPVLIKEFNEISNLINLKAANISIKNYKSMWGCCDGKNNISLNYKLIMLPAHLRRYVVVHELCHTIHHDHSKKFWQAVKGFIPDYKNCVKQLKVYSFINNIYR